MKPTNDTKIYKGKPEISVLIFYSLRGLYFILSPLKKKESKKT